MAKISGKDGTVKYGASPTTYDVTDWSFDRNFEIQDVTDSGDSSTGWRAKQATGWKSGSGNFTAFVEGGVSFPTEGSEVALELISNSARKWAGNGIITSVSEALTVAGGEAQKATFNFETTGAWTKTDTTS